MEHKIKVGDKVKVFVSDSINFWAEVKYMPVATGDSWIVSDEVGGSYYVQTFQMIFKPHTKEK